VVCWYAKVWVNIRWLLVISVRMMLKKDNTRERIEEHGKTLEKEREGEEAQQPQPTYVHSPLTHRKSHPNQKTSRIDSPCPYPRFLKPNPRPPSKCNVPPALSLLFNNSSHLSAFSCSLKRGFGREGSSSRNVNSWLRELSSTVKSEPAVEMRERERDI